MAQKEKITKTRLILQSKDPYNASLWNIGLGAACCIKKILHALGIYPPARLDGDVLDAVNPIRGRDTGHPRVRTLLPQYLAASCIKGPEVAIVGSAHENQPTSRG